MRFEEHLITGERENKLNRWFADYQAEVFLAIVESQADSLEATAVAEMMTEPVAVIAGDEATQSVQDKLKEAATLRLVVEKFREISQQTTFSILKPYVSRPATDSPA